MAAAGVSCRTLQSSTSYSGSCKSWYPTDWYSAEGYCTDGNRFVFMYGRTKFVGPFNTYGDSSRFTCQSGFWIWSARMSINGD